MKVLHIISSSGMYGAEAVILNLSRAWARGPHSMALGVFDNAANRNRELYEAAVCQGLEAHLIPCAGQIDRSTIAAIRKLAETTNADLVHAHGYKADIYCFLGLRSGPIPFVSTCHTWYDTDRMVTVYGKIDRLVLRSFAAVVAVSEEVRQRLLGAGVKPGRISIVRNGIDTYPFAKARPSLRAGLPAGTVLVGLVGRLAWEKGVDLFLAAAAQVLAKFPNARFVVVGEGPERIKLEASLDALNLRSAVSLIGRRDDMPSVYASLDLMVSASRQEGLPIALLEGAASGLPIVATEVGEVPAVVRNGSTGLIVPPEDTSALAEAILALLRDPGCRKQYSAAARELIASEFSADRMAADYLRVYQQALETKLRKSGGSRSVTEEGSGSSRRSEISDIRPAYSGPSRAPAEPQLDQRCPRVFMMDLWATLPYYVAYLSRALLQQGADLSVGSIDYYLDPGCFSSRGIRLDPGLVNIVGRFHLPRWPRRILKLFESLLNLAALTVRFLIHPPDVVHVQFLPLLTSRVPLDSWFVRFCQARGCRLVLTVHDLLPHDTGLTHKAKFLALYTQVDGIICHSASVRDRLVAEFSVPLAKISIIPHGPFFYDLGLTAERQALRRFDLPDDELVVLWQGILFPYKGVDLLLEAWRKVESETTGTRLVIAGTGQPDLLDQIRSQVARLNLQRVQLHFRFISTEELVALYRMAAVVAYPYRAITTSGALATGLALGKTMVATDLPVFRELLTDHENALLVPAPSVLAEASAGARQDEECAAGLANALIELLQNPGLRGEIAARVRAMNFGDESWRAIACQTLEVYRSVLQHS